MRFHSSSCGITGTYRKYMFTFKEAAKLSKMSLPFYILISNIKTVSSTCCQLSIVSLHSVWWYLIVAQTSISLMTNVLNIFPCSYLSFLYLHWCVYSNHLSVQILFVFSLSSKSPLYVLHQICVCQICSSLWLAFSLS